jgi:Tol biopolymer transport system component
VLSREERILSEILVSRGLVPRERIAEHARDAATGARVSLADALVAGGALDPAEAESALSEARSIDEALAPELPLGTRLGEFRLVREIGRGGMGIVYEAHQESLGRPVALKILPAGAALDERLAIRFLREARAAARLRHPAIVPVYTSGRAEGVLYFAMELVPGRTLAAAIADGPLAPEDAARIAAEIARGLDHAHGHGLVHRDVKPENVLLTPDGRARITDFGLVLETGAGRMTLSRYALGTPAFAAPEQARGDDVGPASDVYGLGAVLYAMLAGRPPFADEVPSVALARVLTEAPPDVLALRPDAPPDLAAICRRAMARAPQDRHATAGAMADDLDRFLAGGVVPDASAELRPARSVGAARTAPFRVVGARSPRRDSEASDAPPGRSRRLAAWIGVATALAACALGAGLWARRAHDARTAAPVAPGASLRALPLPPGKKESVSTSRDGTLLAYASDRDGDWNVYVVGADGGEPENVTGGSPADEVFPALAPDGRTVAFVERGMPPSIALLDLGSRALRRVIAADASSLAWSEDGREIYYTGSAYERLGATSSPAKLYAVDVGTGAVRVLTGLYGTQANSAASGGLVTFVSRARGRMDLWTVDPAGGSAVQLTDDGEPKWSPVWSGGGDAIWYGTERHGAASLARVAIDPFTGRPAGAPEAVPGAVFAAPFYLARGGRDAWLLVSVGHEGKIHRVSLGGDENAASIAILPERFFAASDPDLSADGRSLVFVARTDREDVAVSGIGGESPRLLTDDPFADRTPRWSPDGSRIAFASDRGGAMEIWTIGADGRDLAPLPSAPGATGPVWSPDGSEIAFFVPGAGAFVASARGAGSPRALPPLPGDDPAFEPSSWSPDGSALAGGSRGVVVHELGPGAYRRLTDVGSHPVWLDARRIAFTTERAIHVVDLRGGPPRVVAEVAPSSLAGRIAVSTDGASAYAAVAASPDEVWRLAIRGGE